MRVFYSLDYSVANYAFETTRKATWIADSLAECPIPGIKIVAPPTATKEMLCRAHTAEYVDAVRTGEPRRLAESQWFPWDEGLWTMACASTGGAVAAALAALVDGVSGSLSSGLHHARRGQGNAFCTFNGLALAALVALDSAISGVLILDLDAHCGGGTHSLIGNHPAIRHTDISTMPTDGYRPIGANTLQIVTDSANYLPSIARQLEQLEPERSSFGLCLYNAGMDPVEGDGAGDGINYEMLRAREEMVFGWCRRQSLPIAYVLAGGYLGAGLDRHRLVDLHRLTLEAAMNSRGNI